MSHTHGGIVVGKHYRGLENRPVCRTVLDRQSRIDEAWVSADLGSIALAVLEEAFDYDAKHRHRSIHVGCCQYHDLRTRIEKLVKEGPR